MYPLIVHTEELAREAVEWLEQRARRRLATDDRNDVSDALRDADGLVVRTATRVDSALLDDAPKLRVVGRAGTGVDNIDLEECRRRRIEVVYTPEANTQAVVEYVLLILLDALRPRHVLTEPIDAGSWNRLRAETVGTRELAECTLGILGMGRIGRRVAHIAATIGARVLYNDLLDVADAHRCGAIAVTPDVLFAESDVVTLHIDGRAANRRFVGENLIRRMKDEVIFVNTCRGFVVDNVALARFLRDHPGAAACLDVHDPEPFGADYPLLGLPNATLQPHLASRTRTALRAMSWVVRDIIAVLDGHPPRFPA